MPADTDPGAADAARRRRKSDLLAASALLRAQAAGALDEVDIRVGRIEAGVAAVRARVDAWREGLAVRSLRSLALPVAVLAVTAWAARRLLRPVGRVPVPPSGVPGARRSRPGDRGAASASTVGTRSGLALLSVGITMGPRLWRWARRGRRLWWAWRWWNARRMAPASRTPRSAPGAVVTTKDPALRSAVRHDARSRPR